MDVCHLRIEEASLIAWAAEPLMPKTRIFAQHLANGIAAAVEDIDRLIMQFAQNWTLERMASVDRCVLRLGTFELLYDIETPVNVILNEAVEIAKRYSTEDSGKFVNGILDKVKNERKNP